MGGGTGEKCKTDTECGNDSTEGWFESIQLSNETDDQGEKKRRDDLSEDNVLRGKGELLSPHSSSFFPASSHRWENNS